MLRGWFDAFRTDGGPTLYSHANRTPVIEDIRNILIYVTFSTLFIAFLIIFPGIRKERFSTLITVTTSLSVGAVILYCCEPLALVKVVPTSGSNSHLFGHSPNLSRYGMTPLPTSSSALSSFNRTAERSFQLPTRSRKRKSYGLMWDSWMKKRL